MAGTPTQTPTSLSSATEDGVGASPRRPDGTLKVTGDFAYSSDMWHEDMLWGMTLRSPHAHAHIRDIDITTAVALPGVYAVLTHEDVPGAKRYGLEIQDQPVLAFDKVRYRGEPVAIVAADHPETARRALERVQVDYEVLDPVDDARRAVFDENYARVHAEGTLPLHEEHNQRGNLVRHQPVRTGAFASGATVADLRAQADVVVSNDYEVGTQDQAFLGPESGMAVPTEDGGLDLYIATQWLHVDQSQIAPALGLAEDKVRLTLAGVGGAFGAREDLSMQIHACMLALHTGKPVKIVYNREESFYGHVHRHPAQMRYEHGALRDGTLLYATLEIILDGGAYASATPAVVGVASSLGIGPYEVANVSVDAYGVYTTNPPCGAMRGFGAVQACFGYESQLDRLADELDMHPVELRIKNAMSEGSRIITGQQVDMPLPMTDMLQRARDLPLPPPTVETGPAGHPDLRSLPGGVANTTHGEGVVRGVGYAVGIKNICYSEGFDDYSTARVRVEVAGGEPCATVHTAAAEVGQGLVTVKGQIARTELGIQRVAIHPSDTGVGSAGSSSASRQSYMTGGAVKQACAAVRSAIFALARQRGFVDQGRPDAELSLDGEKLVSTADGVVTALVDVLGSEIVEETREFHHRTTESMDPVHGQGDSHTQFAMCVHRAVVDVDTELGLVKVVALDAVQDVGKILHPQQLTGQIEGGATQGLGLALMEEIQVDHSEIKNPSFTDYLIPTILDTPPMRHDILEHPDPHAPYGLRGAGEPPTLSSTPAIVAAIRAATGRPLTHAPVRPSDIVGLET